jgi:iron complex transport system ATP-binding protein
VAETAVDGSVTAAKIAKPPRTPLNALLRASNLSFAYGDRVALRDVSISLEAGQLVGILGPNGSGKSTLIRTLLGQLKAASGSVEWDNRPIDAWRRRDLARRVAYLPQSPAADADQTVLDVLRLGRAPYWQAFGIESPRDHQVVVSVARQLELTDLLTRPMDELSGGQRQRVFVGRCLSQEPAALLLDEPSTFLDLRHQLELFRLLRSLASERSMGVLMASHDLNLASMFCDRLVLLKEGSIRAEGGPLEILRADVLANVFDVAMETVSGADGRVIVVPKVDQ